VPKKFEKAGKPFLLAADAASIEIVSCWGASENNL